MSTPELPIDESHDEEEDMPGRAISSRKSARPTVSYLDVFPDHGDLLKPHAEHESSIKPCFPLNSETLHGGRYLELNKYIFQDSTGNTRSAEGVHMVKNVIDAKHKINGGLTLRNKVADLCTIAVLRKQIMCDSLVLTKQYRAPLKAYTIEFPATVLETGPMSPKDLATKEIEDDTGYSSSIVQYVSPLTALEPDISDGKLQIVSMTIDGDDPMQNTSCNNNNQSHDTNHGSHGDIVEVLKIPINSLLDRLEKYDEQGYVIDSRVMAFAIGLQRGQRFSLDEARDENESTP